MYIIIKRDKAEHLKEKMHNIKTAAMEVLDCIEEASARHSEYPESHFREEARYRAVHHGDHEDSYYPEHDMYRHETRRGRGRY